MKEVETQNISGMEYYNFGFRNELIKNMKTYTNYILDALETVDISLNIDGLPLFKSTHTSLWPVLCQIHLKPKKVFPVVLTIGSSKPDNLNFLNPTIEELNDLLQNGFQVDDKLIHVNLKCIVCDAPARAMVKGIKLYSGYYGCDRCNQKGVYLGRITYQDVENLTLRTDTSFRNQEQIQHHNTNSPFCNLPIDMVNQFPIDYMHQACLGVIKRLLLIWIKKGARRLKLSVQQRNENSDGEEDNIGMPILRHNVRQKTDFENLKAEIQDLKAGQQRLEEKLDILILTTDKEGAMIEDVVPSPVESLEELQQMDQELQEKADRKKMVTYLMTCSKNTVQETVRSMLKATVKNNVLALFSLRGQKGKKAFQKLALYKTITRAVSKSKNCKRVEIDDALIEVLKHAPHMPGGPKYKKRRSTAAVEFTDSDSD